MQTQITNYIRAGYPGLYILTHEERRVEAMLAAIAQQTEFELFAWSVTTGIMETRGPEPGAIADTGDPMEMLNHIPKLPERSIILLRDFHGFTADPNPVLFRKLRDTLYICKATNRVLVVVGCMLALPAEVEKDMTVVEFKLPGPAELQIVLDAVAQSAKIKLNGTASEILRAASGLTTAEAENAFALSFIETGDEIQPSIVAREKASTVKKNGLLEIIQPKVGLDDIGGLDELKTWVSKRQGAFSDAAREYGLPTPKGVLVIGIPGTGKSLTAKATANILGVPLLKLDAGRIFGSLVGQSESNMRAVIQTAEAIAPCVLWIDELEKGFSGSKSSGSTDGGTASRVFASFLQWMQEKTAPVFVVATANDVTQLPPELLRKGRFDEQFFVDLPNDAERYAIWQIQIEKFGRKIDKFHLKELVRATADWTGAEIEALFTEALFAAFEDKGKEPSMELLVRLSSQTKPLSRMMAPQIEALRKWADGRARSATTPPAKPTNARKLALN